MSFFKSKPKKALGIKLEPEVSRFINMEHTIASLAEQLKRDKAGNARICNDLAVICGMLRQEVGDTLERSARIAALLSKAADKVDEARVCLQGGEEQEPAPVKSNGGIVESEIEANPMQPIRFLKDRNHDVVE